MAGGRAFKSNVRERREAERRMKALEKRQKQEEKRPQAPEQAPTQPPPAAAARLARAPRGRCPAPRGSRRRSLAASHGRRGSATPRPRPARITSALTARRATRTA